MRSNESRSTTIPPRICFGMARQATAFLAKKRSSTHTKTFRAKRRVQFAGNGDRRYEHPHRKTEGHSSGVREGNAGAVGKEQVWGCAWWPSVRVHQWLRSPASGPVHNP